MDEFKHSPGPWELIVGNEHHGPYIVNGYGGDVCDFYCMSNPTVAAVRNGGTSYPVSFSSAVENAEFVWRACNSFQVMLEALTNVRKLISEASMMGFNWKDGDWATRLFYSQQTTSAAIKLATKEVNVVDTDVHKSNRTGVLEVKPGDTVLIKAIVKSRFEGKTNWPVHIVIDTGTSETIDYRGAVHYSAIVAVYKKVEDHETTEAG